MSFHLSIFGRRHYLWGAGTEAWFYRPDAASSGGTGVRVLLGIVGAHVVFMWGHR